MPDTIQTIVAGVGSVDEDDPILKPAIRVARRLGAELHLLHALRLPDPLLDAYAGMGLMDAGELRHREQELQARLEARARDVGEHDRIVAHVAAGPADLAIMELVERSRADLVMLGATHGGPIAQAILGTTAQRLLRTARRPVLVVRHDFPEATRRVLLTSDLTRTSVQVHDRALDLVHALWPADPPRLRSLLVVSTGSKLPAPLRQDLLREVAESELRKFLLEPGAGAHPVEGKVRLGSPAKEILAEADEWPSELLVLGTHGRRGMDAFLVGSVAEAVLRRATCSVLVMPIGTHREEMLET